MLCPVWHARLLCSSWAFLFITWSCSVNQCNKRNNSLIRVSAFVISVPHSASSLAILIKLNLFRCHSNWKEIRSSFFFFFSCSEKERETIHSILSFAQNKYVYFVFVCMLNLFSFPKIHSENAHFLSHLHIVLEFSA